MPQELPGAAKVAGSVDGVVVAAQPLAAEAGARMLAAGGNAADAAVAAAFAISVVEPSMNSIGGRTQVLVRTPAGAFAGIDATTQAPATYDAATATQASYGYPTVGVPGALAGLVKLLDEHGTMSLDRVMAPAIELARRGFRLSPGEAARHRAALERIAEFRGTRAHFLTADGQPREAGSLFVQPDLAGTLDAIAKGGPDVFYRGHLADMMIRDLTRGGSPVTRRSLADYRALDARIVRGSYRGYEVVGTDIPASGAVSIGILHVLENFDLSALDEDQWASLVGQAIGKGFEYRGMLGTAADADRFLDKEFAAQVASEISVPGVVLQRAAHRARAPGPRVANAAPSLRRAAPAAPAASASFVVALPGETPTRAAVDWTGATWGSESTHTTHLSAADGQGMYVALTQTIGPNMGSKVATPGLGFLYAATLGGYLGDLEPGERARSSISPLMVLQDGEPVLVLGAAGGARIVSSVVQAVLRFVDQGMTLPDALAAARVHPTDDGVALETSPGIGWGDAVVTEIEASGILVEEVADVGAFGRIHGIFVDPATGERVGVADPDWEGAAIVPSREND